ncbi:MAG: hypothetical protein ACPG7U_04135, partial [Holosporaceae bacterium]
RCGLSFLLVLGVMCMPALQAVLQSLQDLETYRARFVPSVLDNTAQSASIRSAYVFPKNPVLVNTTAEVEQFRSLLRLINHEITAYAKPQTRRGTNGKTINLQGPTYFKQIRIVDPDTLIICVKAPCPDDAPITAEKLLGRPPEPIRKTKRCPTAFNEACVTGKANLKKVPDTRLEMVMEQNLLLQKRSKLLLERVGELEALFQQNFGDTTVTSALSGHTTDNDTPFTTLSDTLTSSTISSQPDSASVTSDDPRKERSAMLFLQDDVPKAVAALLDGFFASQETATRLSPRETLWVQTILAHLDTVRLPPESLPCTSEDALTGVIVIPMNQPVTPESSPETADTTDEGEMRRLFKVIFSATLDALQNRS